MPIVDKNTLAVKADNVSDPHELHELLTKILETQNELASEVHDMHTLLKEMKENGSKNGAGYDVTLDNVMEAVDKVGETAVLTAEMVGDEKVVEGIENAMKISKAGFSIAKSINRLRGKGKKNGELEEKQGKTVKQSESEEDSEEDSIEEREEETKKGKKKGKKQEKSKEKMNK